jgi:peptide/nickel transport system substrate-binding protein
MNFSQDAPNPPHSVSITFDPMRRIYIFIIITVFLAAISSGCRNESSENKNVFFYNENNGITSLDPAFARDLEIMWATNQLYDGLVEITNDLQIIPCIARSWNISDDLTTYTFYIRDDVFFHDSEIFPSGKGRKVTAQDFVYSFNRIIDPKVASPGAWIFSKTKKTAHSPFSAPNDSTFIIQLEKPFPPFLSILSMQYCNVVPHEAIEKYGADFRAKPVGTGPFKFAFWYENNALVFHRNDNFWQKDEAGKNLPYLDAIKIDFIKDPAVEYQGLLAGTYDFISGIHPSYKDELLTAEGELAPAFQASINFFKTPFIKTDYIGFMIDPEAEVSKNSPLLKKDLRRAIELAINKKEMVKFLRNNTVMAASNGFVPPTLLKKNAPEFNLYDPEKAKEILDSLGYKNGNGLPEITITTTGDYTDLIEYIQFNLGKIGLKVKVEVMQGSTFREASAKGKLAAFRKSWLADYPDAENFFNLFLKENFCPTGPNYMHYYNPEFENLYSKILAVQNDSLKQEYYSQMNELISESSSVIPLYYDQVSHFVSPRIKNWEINSINMIDLKKVKKVY